MTVVDGRRWRVVAGVAYVVILALGIALGTWVIAAGYSPVPFADFWGQFPFIERGVRGDVGIADLWAQSNEHRILVARLQFLLDYRFFDGTNVLLFCAIGASAFLLAALFAVAVWVDTRDRLLALGTLAAGTAATLSPVGVENFYWAFQIQFVQVFLFAAAAVLALVLAARGSSPAWTAVATAAAAVAAVGATYSMANGLTIWLVLAALALAIGLGAWPTFVLVAVGVATIGSYLWHYEFSTRGSLSDPAGILRYTFVYLGSVLREGDTVVAGAVGFGGTVLLALLCVVAWTRRRSQAVAVPFGAGVGLFVLLTALQTASGRLDLGVAQALSSRYAIASTTLWLALVVGFLPLVRERFRARMAAPAYLVAAAVGALAVGLAALPHPSWFRTLVVGKETTVLAHRVGVDDPSGTLTGGPSGAVVRSVFEWMERETLGPWARGGMVDGMRVDASRRPPGRSCLGKIEWDEPVGGGRRLRGWIVAPRDEPTSRNLIVFDALGERAGLGLVGTHRTDIEESGVTDSAWRGFVAYVRGTPTPPLSVVLLGDDRRTPMCRLSAMGG